MIVPGPAGYSYNKVAVAVTDVKYQLWLKRCDLILFTWNKLLLSSLWTCCYDSKSRMSFEEPNDPRPSCHNEDGRIQLRKKRVYYKK